MRRKPRNVLYLILGIAGASVTAWFINTYEPLTKIIIAIFFFLILVTSFTTLLFIFNNVRRATLGATGLTIFLMLRYLNLRHIGYTILLIATLVSLELSFQKR